MVNWEADTERALEADALNKQAAKKAPKKAKKAAKKAPKKAKKVEPLDANEEADFIASHKAKKSHKKSHKKAHKKVDPVDPRGAHKKAHHSWTATGWNNLKESSEDMPKLFQSNHNALYIKGIDPPKAKDSAQQKKDKQVTDGTMVNWEADTERALEADALNKQAAKKAPKKAKKAAKAHKAKKAHKSHKAHKKSHKKAHKKVDPVD